MATKHDQGTNDPAKAPQGDGTSATQDTSSTSKMTGAAAAGQTGPGTPNSPRAAGTIGTGGPPTQTTDVDPNIDIAREQARDVRARKEVAGEKTGEAPLEPESLAGRAGSTPTGPVADGFKRVRVLTNVASGGRSYEAGRTVDIPEGDVEALKASGSIEAV